MHLQKYELQRQFIQGILVLTGMETRQIFSRMLGTPKENIELFTPT